jgi:glycosyltransferase involved in cell wall biosynthesis
MRLPEPYGSCSMKRFDPGEPDLNSRPILRKFQYCTLQSRRHQWCHPVTSSRAVVSMYSWVSVSQKFPIDEKKFWIFHGIRSHEGVCYPENEDAIYKQKYAYFTYMSNPMQDVRWKKSKGHWTFHLSNGSNGPPIFHWTFACPLDLMDKWNVHWPAMDQSELCINRIRDHVKVADRNNASTGQALRRFYHYVINRLQDFTCPLDPMDKISCPLENNTCQLDPMEK